MRKIKKKYSAKFKKIYAMTKYLYPENLYGDIDILFGKMKSVISEINIKPTKFYIEIIAENYMDEEEAQILNYTLATEYGVTPYDAIKKMICFLNNKMISRNDLCEDCAAMELKETKADFNKELKEKIAKNLSNDIEFCNKMRQLDKKLIPNTWAKDELLSLKNPDNYTENRTIAKNYVKNLLDIREKEELIKTNNNPKEMEQLSFKFMEKEEVKS